MLVLQSLFFLSSHPVLLFGHMKTPADFHFLFVTGMVFSYASFMVFIGWYKCTWNTQQSKIPSKVAVDLACEKVIGLLWAAQRMELAAARMTHCIDGNNSFSEFFFLKLFFIFITTMLSLKRGTQVEAMLAEQGVCFMRL